jgi:hypothetical protein
MHFINDTISHLVNHFLFQHTTSTTYYPQGNGQEKLTNKVIKSMLTKLVSEKRNDWDEHLGVVLFAYYTAYQISTWHTPFQLMYGLYPLMPTWYLLPILTKEDIDVNNIVTILTNMIFKSWKN